MKSYPFKFLFALVILVAVFSFVIDALHVPPFLLPVLPFFFAVVSREKNRFRRIITIITAMILYSQTAAPLPILFLILITVVLSISSASLFKITTFDIEVVVSLTLIVNSGLIFMLEAILIVRHTGALPWTAIWNSFLLPSLASVVLVFLLQRHIRTIFKRDTWL